MPKPTLADFTPQLPLDDRRVAVDPDSRRIAVRVASFGETHSGFGPEVKVPRNANLDAAHVGSAELADGSTMRVAVLPMDTAHAPANLAALHAASWYENSGKAVARGRYSSDEHGIRFDGLLFDDIDEPRIDRMVAASASGDWRSAIALKRFGDFEHAPADFVGSCIVNIGGYSDTYRPGPGQRLSLVASAAGDLISIQDEGDMSKRSFGTTITAAGVSLDAVRDSAYEVFESARMAEVEAMPADDWPQVLDVRMDPDWVIVMQGSDTWALPWSAGEDGAITLGEKVAVRSEWVPVDADGGVSGETMTASAAEDDEPAVTLSAAALSALLDGSDEDAMAAAREAAQAALVASGAAEEPVADADRIAALEQAVADLTALVASAVFQL